jgi:hypothetical protein
MPVQYGGDKITFADGSTVGSGWSGMKNRLINGGMVFDQRNAGASVTAAGSVSYTLDRFSVGYSADSKVSIQQNAGSVTPPVGFTNYLGATSLSAYSVSSSDLFNVQQIIEGLNISDLAWGTANAAPVTLSFWVRSSLTGTFGGSLRNSANNRSYPFSYTISAANTWEQKSVTVAGDTSGTWLTTNGVGIRVGFGLGAGSTYSGTAGAWAAGNYFSATGATSVVGTNGATFYITGVQLEKGSTATSFDYRPYGTELNLCQRYYQLKNGILAISSEASANNILVTSFSYTTAMRSAPSVSQTGVIRMEVPYGNSSVQSSINVLTDTGNTGTGGSFILQNFSGLTYARTYRQMSNGGGDLASITLSAEL